VLLAVAAVPGPAAEVLANVGLTADTLRATIGDGTRRTVAGGHIPFTKSAKKVLELSLREALRLGHRSISAAHIGMGLLRSDELDDLLVDAFGVDLLALRQELEQVAAADDEVTGGSAWRPSRRERGRVRELVEKGRTSDALRRAIEAAEADAGEEPVATHHLFVAALRDPESAAAKAFAAQGLDPAQLAEVLASASTEGTSDESPTDRAARRTTLAVEDGAAVVRIADETVAAALQAGLDASGGTERSDLLPAFAGVVEDVLEVAARLSAAPGAPG
jgi:ATP-dependent Clp protease ATP-binding subunit ClpA